MRVELHTGYGQPLPCLVDQRCGLKCLAFGLVRHFLHRESAELFIDQWKQLVGSLGIASINGAKHMSDVRHRRIHPNRIARRDRLKRAA